MCSNVIQFFLKQERRSTCFIDNLSCVLDYEKKEYAYPAGLIS